MSRPRNTTVALVLATVVAVGYVMFVPARNYVAQQAATDDAERQLSRLEAQIDDLEERQVELRDPGQIERVARERFNLGYPGEEVFAVLPAPPPPLPIPTGWPFDVLRGAAALDGTATGG